MDMAELHQIHVWDCDHCGTENRVLFQRVVRNVVDIDKMAEEAGVDPKDLRWRYEIPTYAMPEVVTCTSCKRQYRAFVGSYCGVGDQQ